MYSNILWIEIEWVPLSIIQGYCLVMGMLSCLHLLLSHGQFGLGIPRSWMCTYYTP